MSQEFRSVAIIEFYRRAAEARRIAETAANSSERADFLAIEERWLSLVRDKGLKKAECA
jgi:hypothetical protein